MNDPGVIWAAVAASSAPSACLNQKTFLRHVRWDYGDGGWTGACAGLAFSRMNVWESCIQHTLNHEDIYFSVFQPLCGGALVCHERLVCWWEMIR